MATCAYCNDPLTGIPFKCKLCGDKYCGKHRLAENHECINVNVYRDTSYSPTKLNKDREIKKVKRTGAHQGEQQKTIGTPSGFRVARKIQFRMMLFGNQSVNFLENKYYAAFTGGAIFGLVLLFDLFFGGDIIPRDPSGWLFALVSLIISAAGFTFIYWIRKRSADNFSFNTEFGIWPIGILITIITSFFFFTFYLFGFYFDEGGNVRSRGITSIKSVIATLGIWVVGRFVIPIAIVFVPEGILVTLLSAIIVSMRHFAIWAFIMMLPFGILDGKKIWDYNRNYYIGLAVVTLATIFL